MFVSVPRLRLPKLSAKYFAREGPLHLEKEFQMAVHCRGPVIETVDIWRKAAALVITRRGESPQFAARQALRLRNNGDAAGYALWVRIGRAVMELERTEPAPNEAIQ